ncbi:MAG: thioredoxin family protein [Proteobacteria bacterium]|nr:thioredoxin family protein [Pseudomonadota bacterium]
MTAKRTVEIFSAGCELCQDAVRQVRDMACPSCDVIVLDMNDKIVIERAKSLGVNAVPAVAVNGLLIASNSNGSLDESALRSAGIGQG